MVVEMERDRLQRPCRCTSDRRTFFATYWGLRQQGGY